MQRDCEWIVVRDVDWRLNRSLPRTLYVRGIPIEHALIAWPGCAKSFEAIGRIQDTMRMHHASKLVLVWNTDSGAMGWRERCGVTERADWLLQLRQLRAAMALILQRCPGLKESRMILARIVDDGQIVYEDVAP
ncbi:MAG: hypothetical protein WCT33_01505 [Patescibacteria group bacterium]|jgi:hypothetical protein